MLAHSTIFPVTRDALKTITLRPGVYQMRDAESVVLYVGKAKQLKKRLLSYFSQTLSAKTARLMAQVTSIDTFITETEAEALILECQLIKKFQPKYNVLLRDDKSYPSIFLSTDSFPRLELHRGKQVEKGRYFGPYPNSQAAHSALSILQTVFLVRQCSNSYYAHRTRPCLQYQIKRCTAPCVGLISQEAYTEDVAAASLFLEGKDDQVIQQLLVKMEQASTERRYEDAARLRDSVQQLRQLREQRLVHHEEADVIGFARVNEKICVQVMTIREGRWLFNQSFFPTVPNEMESTDILQAFLEQFYVSNQLLTEYPKKIFLPFAIPNQGLIVEILSDKRSVTVVSPQRGEAVKWIGLANTNAEHALMQRVSSAARSSARLCALKNALDLAVEPNRIDCFDISHTSGVETVASCVVCTQGVMNSAEYRRFIIREITPGDDYAAMQQAVKRRYTALREQGTLPDLLLIDGGKGQVAAVQGILTELGIQTILIVGIAKGPTRKAGLESLIIEDKTIRLPEDSEALHLLQEIRDEAHRFAITGHRKRRARALERSHLEEIAGIGAQKRRELLKQFGGLQGVKQATIEELSKVPGISKTLAKRVYDAFHEA